uniref:Zf-CCHC domain-containing protein/UBN2 domain-containing protein n=1 Tax=Tanacetum cinerariifolium TaxID=118510 RepID=A0A6L2NDS0_TANCI|nr:zf-CCHC domain-containing protein/UBN2 domain-containing protein [Tanacetum cinerariifolium]
MNNSSFSKDESIYSAFSRFNTIITSLKSIDEGYSSKNYVRKFLRALHHKWRATVTAIKDSKDLISLSLDELIRNLKVQELIIKKDFEIVKGKGERKSLALKAKKESSDEESLTFGSKDEEYAIGLETLKSSSKEEVGPDEWIKYSGCTKHMTGNRKLLSTYKAYNGDHVDNLRFNLLSVGQIYDNKCKVIFFEHDSEITKDEKVIGRGIRKSGFNDDDDDVIGKLSLELRFRKPWFRKLGLRVY